MINVIIGLFGSLGNITITANNLLVIFYFIASLAETNRIPHDLPESESESVAWF